MLLARARTAQRARIAFARTRTAQHAHECCMSVAGTSAHGAIAHLYFIFPEVFEESSSEFSQGRCRPKARWLANSPAINSDSDGSHGSRARCWMARVRMLMAQKVTARNSAHHDAFRRYSLRRSSLRHCSLLRLVATQYWFRFAGSLQGLDCADIVGCCCTRGG